MCGPARPHAEISLSWMLTDVIFAEQSASPVQECHQCARGRYAGAPQCPWSSWPLSEKLRRCQKLLKDSLPSTSELSASTLPHKIDCWTDSQTRTQHNRHLCPCWRRMCHWNPQRWTHRNLKSDSNVELSFTWRHQTLSENHDQTGYSARSHTHPLQYRGQNWLSEPTLCPDVWPPSWDQFV